MQTLETAFEKTLAQRLGLDDYLWIMNFVKTGGDVAADDEKGHEFRQRFNAFYKIRRTSGWQSTYYQVFQAAISDCEHDFVTIIRGISVDSRVELSFASKMLATIDDSQPVWDANVICAIRDVLKSDLVHVSPRASDFHMRLQQAIEAYRSLQRFYASFATEKDGKDCIEQFDRMFADLSTPDGKLYTQQVSDVKKIDYALWCLGGQRNRDK